MEYLFLKRTGNSYKYCVTNNFENIFTIPLKEYHFSIEDFSLSNKTINTKKEMEKLVKATREIIERSIEENDILFTFDENNNLINTQILNPK